MKKILMLILCSVLISTAIILLNNNESIIRVKTASALVREIVSCVQADGVVEEASRSEIYGLDGGIVTKVLVAEGDSIKVGDVIVKLHDGRSIKTKINGVVNTIACTVGYTTSSEIPVAVVGDNSKLIVRASTNEKYISKVKEGNKVEITCIATPGVVYKGTVKSIAKNAKQVIGGKELYSTVEVVIALDNENKDLKPGYSAEVSIITNRNANAITVPFEAIVNYQGEKTVWVSKNGKAVPEKVVTGEETDLETEIIDGVKQGEIVILNPPSNISANLRVDNKK